MRAFVSPNLQHPRMAQRQPGSMFTPAIAAWSSPGAMGSYMSGLGALPAWAGSVGAAGFIALAFMRKIPWWAGIGGAVVAYMYLGAQTTNVLQTLTAGTGIVANSTTLQFSPSSPATLITAPDNSQAIQVAGITYPLITQQNNADGSVTYFMDNPA